LIVSIVPVTFYTEVILHAIVFVVWESVSEKLSTVSFPLIAF